MDLPIILFLLALVLQLPKKILQFYRARNLISVFTTARPILSQLNPIHILPTDFFRICYIIFPSTPRSSRRSVSLRYPHQNLLSTYLHTHTCHMPWSSHLSWIDHSKNIWRGLQVIKLIIMPPSPLPCHLVPLTAKYLPQHHILKYP